VGLDWAFAHSFTLGTRLGYAFRGGGPTVAGGSSFLPLHAEGRLSYFVGGPAYGPGGIAPFIFAGGGLGQIDSQATSTVREDTMAPRPANQFDNPPQQELAIWKKSGAAFAAAGGGAYFAVGETQGALLTLQGAILFPSPGTAVTAGLGYAIGL
jgi:hypothetical protein